MISATRAARAAGSGRRAPALRWALRGLPALLVLGTAACANLSASERSAACATTDWYSYGVTDGRLGVPESERADLFAECSEQGQPVDLAAYRSGRALGLEEYCDAETGYRVGSEGGRYRDVCTGQAELAFLQGYEQGRAARPRYPTGPRFGLGVGVGSGNGWGGIGLGFPFFHHGLGYHDYCFYNRAYCRARGWY